MMHRAKRGIPCAWLMNAVRSETDECLLWPFSLQWNGYGQINLNGKVHRTHRFVCELAHGSPPTSSHQAAHQCGVRACVNPRHIRWATPRENQLDRNVHGTSNHGARNPSAKLTSDDVDVIAALIESGLPSTTIAEQFLVSPTTIRDIKKGRTWTKELTR